jgi:leader peptidase (prepilin peptidase)/N-methyltransferase
MRIFATFFAALLGLAFGSFLNVCLSRWPYGESIVSPGSHCRNCGHKLSWRENIPLLSWIFLHGCCRNCRNAISWRYPLVEALVAVLWASQGWHFMGLTADPLPPSSITLFFLFVTIGKMLFLWMLVALAFLDAENFWLPDKLTLTGTVIGLIISITTPFALIQLDAETGLPLTVGFDHLLFGIWTLILFPLAAVAIAASIILIIRWLYWLVRRKEGMGLGDAKLMAMLAAWLGLPGALLSLFIGVTLGAVYAVFLLIQGRQVSAEVIQKVDSEAALPTYEQVISLKEEWSVTHLPLGTFLCIGGAISSIFGERLIAIYLRWAGF